MKFTGLILICASSCLALLLPAIGVVQFPKIQQQAAQPELPGYPISTPASPNSAAPVWQPAIRNDVMPSGPMLQNPFPQAQPPMNTTLPIDPQAQVPQANSRSKLGMGIWLLLGPVCLIGLALWTIAPNPSGGGRSRV
ncbi:MAG: hypothetical protein ABL921_31435 [Pirellula sp.]